MKLYYVDASPLVAENNVMASTILQINISHFFHLSISSAFQNTLGYNVRGFKLVVKLPWESLYARNITSSTTRGMDHGKHVFLGFLFLKSFGMCVVIGMSVNQSFPLRNTHTLSRYVSRNRSLLTIVALLLHNVYVYIAFYLI